MSSAEQGVRNDLTAVYVSVSVYVSMFMSMRAPQNNGCTPVFMAAFNGVEEAVARLTAAKCDVDKSAVSTDARGMRRRASG
eukprot:3922987-Rhodomonas_salina.1